MFLPLLSSMVALSSTSCHAFTTSTRTPSSFVNLQQPQRRTQSYMVPFTPTLSSSSSSSSKIQQGQHQHFPEATTRNHLLHQRHLSPRSSSTTRLASVPETISSLVSSLFRCNGQVPLPQAFGWNAFLFLLLRPKLLKMLTPEGFFHALALGTMLWNTLGWRGWTLCVLYLGLGSLVTKVKFQKKQEMGIAEGRGGRRGPENVWYVSSRTTSFSVKSFLFFIHPTHNACNAITFFVLLGALPQQV
jgi:Integral membrane protein DUF92